MSTPQPAQSLIVNDLTVTFAGRSATTLFDGLDLVVNPGERVALIGENGAGKSTLLRVVAGLLPAQAEAVGTIHAPRDLFYVSQEPPFPDEASVAWALDRALRPLRDATREVERLATLLDDPVSAARYDAVLQWAITHDAWDADRRAAESAARLRLDGLSPERCIGSLSGGERIRLAFAVAMTRMPDCLLLDEPTNHLDDDAIAVVGEFMRSLSGVVLFASHDRILLDEVATALIDLDPSESGVDGQGGRRFGGGWSAYAEHRLAARARWEQTYRREQEVLAALRAATRVGTDAIAHNRASRDNDKYIYGFKGARVDATLARRNANAARRLEIAEREQVRKPPAPLRLQATLGSEGARGRIVQVRDLVVNGRCEVSRLDVDAAQHVLVTGANGTGKSTLLGVLAGRVAPTSGRVDVLARRVFELAQDVRFVDLRRSAHATYVQSLGERAQANSLTDLGILHPRAQAKPVGALSVGQRRRLALAITLAQDPDLLLLDEPTNHLSLSLVDELESALAASLGTVVIASHDRWLRRRWEGQEVQLR